MFERFTERSREVISNAQDEARTLKHNYIGTEHILLGLLRGDGHARRVLDEFSIDLERVRGRVLAIVSSGDEAITGQIPFTPRAKKIMEMTLREALSMGDNYIHPEHILLALVRQTGGVASLIFEEAGIDAQDVRDRVCELMSGRTSPATSRATYSAIALMLLRRKIADAKDFALDRGFAEAAVDLRKIEIKLDV